MKKLWVVCLTAVCLTAPASLLGQNPKDAQLNTVLREMNAASTHFRSATADFVRDNYTAVVGTHEKKSGNIAFRRVHSSTEMMLHITSAGNQQVLYKDGVLDYYEPNLHQETIMPAGKNRDMAESLLTLGFGSSGSQLMDAWQVTFEGWDTIDGVKVAKLNLVSKNQSLRDKYYSHIMIWIDPVHSIAYKQELFSPSDSPSMADVSTVTYSDIRYNVSVPDSLFKLKVAKGTRRIVR